jgi:hypothetical protein
MSSQQIIAGYVPTYYHLDILGKSRVYDPVFIELSPVGLHYRCNKTFMLRYFCLKASRNGQKWLMSRITHGLLDSEYLLLPQSSSLLLQTQRV